MNVEDILSKTISELMDKRLDNAIEVLEIWELLTMKKKVRQYITLLMMRV